MKKKFWSIFIFALLIDALATFGQKSVNHPDSKKNPGAQTPGTSGKTGKESKKQKKKTAGADTTYISMDLGNTEFLNYAASKRFPKDSFSKTKTTSSHWSETVITHRKNKPDSVTKITYTKKEIKTEKTGGKANPPSANPQNTKDTGAGGASFTKGNTPGVKPVDSAKPPVASAQPPKSNPASRTKDDTGKQKKNVISSKDTIPKTISTSDWKMLYFGIGIGYRLLTDVNYSETMTTVSVNAADNTLQFSNRGRNDIVACAAIGAYPWIKMLNHPLRGLGIIGTLNLLETNADFYKRLRADPGIGLAFMLGNTNKYSLAITYDLDAVDVYRDDTYILYGQRLTDNYATKIKTNSRDVFDTRYAHGISIKFIWNWGKIKQIIR